MEGSPAGAVMEEGMIGKVKLTHRGGWHPDERMSAKTVAARRVSMAVARGVRWLDEHQPGWWKTGDGGIELSTLNLHYPCECILGQLEDDFYESCYKNGLLKPDAQRLGFTATKGMSWRSLTAEWKRVIRTRRKSDVEKP